MSERETMTAYLSAFVDELAMNLIEHVVVCPGSRSTPLALLLAEHPDIQVHINVDERSAAFFALGMAKGLGKPVAILCTSGTAAANFYPAIIEAYYSRVPLVVLTADRPHELRDVGAPQAIDQIHLYGKHVKWFAEMALPESSKNMVTYARNVCARAAATASNAPAGPVHLNFPLREPLVPLLKQPGFFGNGRRENQTDNTVQSGFLSLSQPQFDRIADLLSASERGMIVCGDINIAGFREAVVALAEKTGFPILADPLSQLRSSSCNNDLIIDSYDTFLRFEQVAGQLNPDVVIRFGAMPVSKALTQFLKRQSGIRHFIVDSGAGWREPAGIAPHMIYCDETLFCTEMTSRMNQNSLHGWTNLWKTINNKTVSALRTVRDDAELNEGKLFSLLQDYLPENTALFVSNSMPIRDLDTFFTKNKKEIKIFANRGVNGIDGIVSTALGVSTVFRPTVLVLGDLSFFHDMNGLLAARLQKLNLTILLVNNDGGGIFSFLPQYAEKEHFEVLFGTPHGLDFSHAVELYGGAYSKAETWENFRVHLEKSFRLDGLKVIEVPTDRESNVQKHRDLWNYVSQEIINVLIEEKNENNQ
ncbi:2-succinyl-5-enolpyruvyl-6-hydroxy-3-cyclohexene-1-carboxylic-acid synthase [Peribacillus saganii]|uniref:2-succinyl-5-enolpyruvyl-6-hydroxy-3-cyclohexene-1-carboxylate synthase n=1 Tax=Peribacillus saganii TaxID=2303992 RepID=A0A372LCC5_9BACI|nr:2-succinyl-5-enolpyruvyl-6-hydroxy-3-cyclohexene-1-carboxylic-acid synthase [Peribacillus saganii]RFU63645.1 2-succinyl-5-enolpyruvyl-6-hydroxy-3-cyclohexene-1-carboxylic-acid synthase [Peribacillus saganii]